MPAKRKFWYCKAEGGHVVGEVVELHLSNDAGHVKVLALYEKALPAPPDDVPPLRSEKVFHAEGMVCSICAGKFDWFPTLPSLMKLMARFGKDVTNG